MRLADYLELGEPKKISPAQWAERTGVERSTVEKHCLPPDHPRFRWPKKKVMEAYARESRGKVTPNDFLSNGSASQAAVAAAPAGTNGAAGGNGAADGVAQRRGAVPASEIKAKPKRVDTRTMGERSRAAKKAARARRRRLQS